MFPISFEWLSPLSRSCSLSLNSFLTFLYLPFFKKQKTKHKNSPNSRSPRPSLVAAVFKIIIKKIFPTRFISGWTMQKIKIVIPRSHKRTHCLKICYWELNPYHFVRRMNRLPSFKAAVMHESELVNCETTPSERGLEYAAEVTTHTLTHTLIWILFETILWLSGGDRRSLPVTPRPTQVKIGNDFQAATTVEVASV